MTSREVFPTHTAFADAAQSFVEANSHSAAARPANDALLKRIWATYRDWRWAQPTGPFARGYLVCSRIVPLAITGARDSLAVDCTSSPDLVTVSFETSPVSALEADEADPSTADCSPAVAMLHFTCHIVYSPTYRVPQMLVSAHSSGSGTPATLENLIALGMIRPPASAISDKLGIAVELVPPAVDGATFPLLSLTEHPVTGEMMWALHPCHLTEVVEEILATEVATCAVGVRWLETWLMVVGSVVDLSTRS